jgi:hypothetical protein
MPTALMSPFAATIALVVLALVLTKLWASGTISHAVRELSILGMRPGRSYKLGPWWLLVAARDRRNLLWAVLSTLAWVGVVVSVNLARTT